MNKRLNHAKMREQIIDDSIAFVLFPMKVTRHWRDAVLSAIPALAYHTNAKFYREFLQYLLCGSLRDDETGLLVVPAALIAKIADKHVGQNGFVALNYLESFSNDVFKLKIYDYIPTQKARTVDFSLPTIILDGDDGEIENDDDNDLVWWVTGLPVSPKSRRKHAERYVYNISQLSDGVDRDHPAYDLMQYLNEQGSICLGKKFETNWKALVKMYSDMKRETEEEKQQVVFVRQILHSLRNCCKLVYHPCKKSARIVAGGTSVHSLPREFRKVALSGCAELDIRSSQLSIIATLWDLPKCSEFLATGKNFWKMMMSYLDIDKELKQSLKTTLYATCFGMGRAELLKRLSFGFKKKITGIGEEKAKMFFRHPLIVEILAGRSRKMKQIRDDGGIKDAFERWIPVSDDSPQHSLLAVEAQSWELRLMLPIFEEVKQTRDARILSWLHDGVAIYHPDSNRLNGLKLRVKKAFDSNASLLGFRTYLEIEKEKEKEEEEHLPSL